MDLRLFRYSGNKAKLLPLYRKPPVSAQRIVEPYLGSGAYGLNTDLPVLGYDLNQDLVAMWHWLQKATIEDLKYLETAVDMARFIEEKPDCRNLKLATGPQTYVKINVCSVVVGQLSSWKIYPQHKLPVEQTIQCLSRLKRFEVHCASANSYEHKDGDLLFIDPPYVATSANYGKGMEDSYNPEDTVKLITSTTNHIIFTYGTSAPTIFPQYKWELVKTVKVPNMRKGGTTERHEYVAYINW